MAVLWVTHSVCENSGKRSTIHIEGDVESDDWDKLREFCLGSLKCCDHLGLNLNLIGGYDISFSVLVCLLKRTVQRSGKQLTVYGRNEGDFICVYEASLASKNTCSMIGPGNPCIWENLYFKPALQNSKLRQIDQ